MSNEKFFTTMDLARRYSLADVTSIFRWIRKGKFPKWDITGPRGVRIWRQEKVINWEKSHGGDLATFRKFLSKKTRDNKQALWEVIKECHLASIKSREDDSRQIEFSEPLSPEVNSDNGDSAVRVDGIIRKLLADSPAAQQENNGLAAPEADNHDSGNEIFYPSKTIADYDVHEKITQANKNVAALSSRVIAFTGEIDSLRDSVHALVKIVSILTNAQRNSSGLLYGQVKAALIPLEALEKEFNGDDISAQTEDSGE